MTPEEERWAEALAVIRIHGDGAERYICERIGALALAGDQAGIERWRAIARRIDALLRPVVA